MLSLALNMFVTPLVDFVLFCGYCDAKERAWRYFMRERERERERFPQINVESTHLRKSIQT